MEISWLFHPKLVTFHPEVKSINFLPSWVQIVELSALAKLNVQSEKEL
jgi:hypothetical protein